MAIPNFFAQGQQALQTGLGLGQQIQQNRLREALMPMQQQQMELQNQLTQQRITANEQAMQQAQQQDAQKQMLQGAVMLSTLDFEGQNAMFPQLINQAGDNPMMIQGINELAKIQDPKERNTQLFEFIGAMQGQLPGMQKAKKPRKSIESEGGITHVYDDGTQEFVPWSEAKTEADLKALEDTPYELSAGQKDTLNELDNSFITSRNAARGAVTMANRFKNAADSLPAGWKGSTNQTIAAILGDQNAGNVLRTDYTNFVNQQVVQNLPPGVASDKDIEMVKAGFLPENAKPEAIENWLRAYANVKDAAAQYEEWQANYFRENGGTRGTARRDINVLGVEVKKGERMDDAFKRFVKENKRLQEEMEKQQAEMLRQQSRIQSAPPPGFNPNVGLGTVLAPQGMPQMQQPAGGAIQSNTQTVNWEDLP